MATVSQQNETERKHPTILVIDDDDATATCVQELFAFDGYDVQICADGRKGLEAILKTKPNLVILDLMVPELSGEDVIRELKSLNVDVPVVLISAFTHLPERAKKLGVTNFHSKPFDFEDLQKTVTTILHH